jgi:two-component sensor histidine kinase
MNAMRPDRLAASKPAAGKLAAEPSGPEAYAPERRMPEKPIPMKLGDIDQAVANAFEGEIREFVRRDVNAARRQRSEPEANNGDAVVAENLNNLIRRVSGASMEEIDRVMGELQSVRDMLRQEGERVSREVAGYASLSHAAMTAMSVIADSLTQWKGQPPTLQPAKPQQPRSDQRPAV